MKFTIKERLQIPKLFPIESSLKNQLIVKAIIKKIAITKKDIDRVGLKKTDSGKLTWNPKKDKPINLKFIEEEKNFLISRVLDLDNSEKVTQGIVDICQKILKK